MGRQHTHLLSSISRNGQKRVKNPMVFRPLSGIYPSCNRQSLCRKTWVGATICGWTDIKHAVAEFFARKISRFHFHDGVMLSYTTSSWRTSCPLPCPEALLYYVHTQDHTTTSAVPHNIAARKHTFGPQNQTRKGGLSHPSVLLSHHPTSPQSASTRCCP